MTKTIEALLKRTFVDFQQMNDFARDPLIFSRAQGVYYWDVNGRRFFDALGGVFVAVLGHGHPRVLEALYKQAERMTFAPPLHGISDVTMEFIDRISQITPGALNYVKPFSGGSEAMEAALKFTRQYFRQTGRPAKHKFITRYQGYHGATFGAMAASGTGARKSKFEPQMPGFLKVFPPTHYRTRFSDWAECNRFAAQSVEDIIVAEDPSTVAAVAVEPIGNTGGIITPTREYFEMLRAICDRYDVLLIFDEIITGFGRTGNLFAAQTFGVTPDLLCGGKGISNGVIPLGVMTAREDMGEAFLGDAEDQVQFMHGHTYAGNPLASAVGLAVIEVIVRERLWERAERMGAILRAKLESLDRLGVIREVRGKGMLLGVELTDTRIGTAMRRTALKNGLILRVDPSWFAIAPALTATETELDEMFGLIERSLQDAIAEA